MQPNLSVIVDRQCGTMYGLKPLTRGCQERQGLSPSQALHGIDVSKQTV